MRDILVGRFSAGAVSCGENYTFGDNGSGNVEVLRRLCRKYGIELYVAPMVEFDGMEISSTRIREAIRSGDMQTAAKMLGRPFSYDFTVVAGDRRGHLLGFPTINQFFPILSFLIIGALFPRRICAAEARSLRFVRRNRRQGLSGGDKFRSASDNRYSLGSQRDLYTRLFGRFVRYRY